MSCLLPSARSRKPPSGVQEGTGGDGNESRYDGTHALGGALIDTFGVASLLVNTDALCPHFTDSRCPVFNDLRLADQAACVGSLASLGF